MSKVLFAVLTCNRFHYLRNCVESIFEFVDLSESQVLIVDICTVEPEAGAYYDSISDKIAIKRFEDRVPNELYRAMNYAIKYCFKHKISYVNFVQDDYQYLYRIPNMVKDIVNMFGKYKKMGQIQTNMIWKRKSPGKVKIIRFNNTNYAILEDRLLVDSGFTRVKLYKKTGFYPEGVISYDQKSEKTFGFGKDRYKKTPNGELWFGKKCRKLGYVRVISLHPNMAMMFDCAYVRKWHRFGRYFPPPAKYYLRPLDDRLIGKIARRHKKKKFSHIETFASPDGWEPTTYDKHNREGIKHAIK